MLASMTLPDKQSRHSETGCEQQLLRAHFAFQDPLVVLAFVSIANVVCHAVQQYKKAGVHWVVHRSNGFYRGAVNGAVASKGI